MQIWSKVSRLRQINSLIWASTLLIATGAIASEPPNPSNVNLLEKIEEYNQQQHSLEQITSVSQLKDVEPTTWAYEALRSLVEKYGCIVGYPERTFRGDRALSRYEFAAGLNACLQQMERLIAQSEAVFREDIEKLKRLMQEFEAELSALGARVDNLEGRVAFLEEHQFSTTTKLTGEVVFAVAAATDNQAVWQNRVRLYLETSFNGEDKLYTDLAAGSSPRFQFVSNPEELPGIKSSVGILTFQDFDDNDVSLDFLSYYFPVGDRAEFFVTGFAGGTYDYLPTSAQNPLDDEGDGASGALSLFASQNSLYYIGGGAGAGFNFKLSDVIQLSASYLAGPSDAANPKVGVGLFNGDYAALGQITLTPIDNLTFALTYVNSYHQNGTALFNFGFATIEEEVFGVVGTSLANFPGGADARISANSFGIQANYRVTPELFISAWGGYTNANITNFNNNDGEIWNYAVALAFPDLFQEGNLGGLILGVEPYLGNPQQMGFSGTSNRVPLHVEALYRYQFHDNISITPGLIYLSSTNQEAGKDAFWECSQLLLPSKLLSINQFRVRKFIVSIHQIIMWRLILVRFERLEKIMDKSLISLCD